MIWENSSTKETAVISWTLRLSSVWGVSLQKYLSILSSNLHCLSYTLPLKHWTMGIFACAFTTMFHVSCTILSSQRIFLIGYANSSDLMQNWSLLEDGMYYKWWRKTLWRRHWFCSAQQRKRIRPTFPQQPLTLGADFIVVLQTS